MINSFREHVLGGCIEIIFYAFVNYLEQVGEVRYENVFIDGTKYIWREREMRVKAREFIKTILLTGGLGGTMPPSGGVAGASPRRGGIDAILRRVGGDFPLLYWITTIVPADLPRIW
jgi:hypothetical protein